MNLQSGMHIEDEHNTARSHGKPTDMRKNVKL